MCAAISAPAQSERHGSVFRRDARAAGALVLGKSSGISQAGEAATVLGMSRARAMQELSVYLSLVRGQLRQ
jgi:hypothetical protein